MLNLKFKDYKSQANKMITLASSEIYPDYLDDAIALYAPYIQEFKDLVSISTDSEDLLRKITLKTGKNHIQLLRIFRKFVSPDTSVEMLKRKTKIPEIIEDFGPFFKDLTDVKIALSSRPVPDEALIAILYEYKDRGQKGYDLTENFFDWFENKFGNEFTIIGPRRAGGDVILSNVLPDYIYRTPADFVISRKIDDTPLVIGFARYDSDRGGSQADDRTGGNRDKIPYISQYSSSKGLNLKILFLNDGPGLTLGEMWDTYAELEEFGGDNVRVCTTKMLETRFTKKWFDN